MKKNKIKTCISLDTDVAQILSNMSEKCNVNKSDIINALIYDAYQSNREITIHYRWRDENE